MVALLEILPGSFVETIEVELAIAPKPVEKALCCIVSASGFLANLLDYKMRFHI